MASRTFVVTVSEAPKRVVVEDVRSRRRSLAEDLGAVGKRIAELLDQGNQPSPREAADRDVSES